MKKSIAMLILGSIMSFNVMADGVGNGPNDPAGHGMDMGKGNGERTQQMRDRMQQMRDRMQESREQIKAKMQERRGNGAVPATPAQPQ